MNTQRVIENLLLVTGASRAMLLRASPVFAIEAEAVQHGEPQLRHHGSATGLDAQTIETLRRSEDVLVEQGMNAGSNADTEFRITARMLAPITSGGQLAGVIALHHSSEGASAPRWRAQDQDAMRNAQTKIRDILSAQEQMERPAREDLRSAATQAILDRARLALDVQRCTFRQPVQEAFAFPVTFESRAEGLRSLLGDLTIVQTGQPVIVKLLSERKQVVQEDCRVASDDPLFHKMLAHYGGMRAQVVTPFIVGDQLKGVLSIHELRHPRKWTEAEKALAAEAAALIGAIFEMKV